MDLELIVRRTAIVKAIRQFFDESGFLEVETPVRIEAPAPECHIDCPPVTTGGFLRASPELQMKKLMAAGLDRIYQIGPCFRDGERGSRHSPEFTMIEWYRKGSNYMDILEDTKALVQRVWRSVQDSQPNVIPCPSSFVLLPVREAYRTYAGWDPWTVWDQDRFDFDMATVIEPKLKEIGGGVFLMDYPVQAASLSKVSQAQDGAAYAERWEFYWDGMELANCFTELCDDAEQRRRFEAAKEERKTLGEADYPLDEGFFTCLPQIGSAAGVALGVDRLVLMLTGAKDIQSIRVGD